MTPVLIALGSNLGDRLANLREATRALGRLLGPVEPSGVYETAPMYVTDQPAFLNAAVQAETDLAPRALLAELKRIEREIGRTPSERYGPRLVDLDLIAYGALRYRFSEDKAVRLEIPHPRIPERRFVLAPLNDVAPEFVLPVMGRVRDLLAQTEDQANTVNRIDDGLLSL